MTASTPFPDACDAFADLLVDYSDDELSEEERRIVNGHVAECVGCREHLERLDASREQLLGAVHLAASGGSGQLPEQQRVTTIHRRYWNSVLALATTAAVVLVGCFSTWWFAQRRAAVWVAGTLAVEKPAGVADKLHKLTPGEARWHVAIVEQQARLEASLELLPRDGVYASQREQDEQLLAKFQTLVRDIQ